MKTYYEGVLTVILPGGKTEKVKVKTKTKRGRDYFLTEAMSCFGMIYDSVAEPKPNRIPVINMETGREVCVVLAYKGDFGPEIQSIVKEINRKGRQKMLVTLAQEYVGKGVIKP